MKSFVSSSATLVGKLHFWSLKPLLSHWHRSAFVELPREPAPIFKETPRTGKLRPSSAAHPEKGALFRVLGSVQSRKPPPTFRDTLKIRAP